MKKRIICLFLTVVFLCAACQKTPETEIIVNKGNGVEAIVEETAAPTRPIYEGIPSALNLNWESERLIINIAADVFVPKVTSVPVYQVTEPVYTQRQVDMAVKALLGNAVLYDTNSMAYTKEELMEMLLYEKRLLEDVKSGENTIYQGTIEHLEDNIRLLEEKIKHVDDFKPLTVETSAYSQSRNLNVYTQEQTNKKYFIATSENILYMRYYIRPFVPTSYLKEEEMISLSLKRTDAEAAAKRCVQELGYTDMDISAVSKGELLSGEESIGSGKNELAYIFFFTRTVDGIPLTYEEHERASAASGNESDANLFSHAWEYESIRVAVSDAGVEEVYINGNLLIGNKVNENVQLLPFETILEHAKAALSQKYSFLDSRGVDAKSCLRIDRIKFGYMQVATSASKDYHLLIPVWDFYGALDMVETDGTLNQAVSTQYSELTINAMDGSLIDRDKGY